MKMVTAQEAIGHLRDGMTIMIGGFMSNGTPEILVDAVVESGVKNLTIIANDSGSPGVGIGKLIDAGIVKKIITSHIGLNPVTGNLMNSGDIDVILIPQGTLIEQIRAAGAGLGGVLTPTGLGTSVAAGKEIIVIDGIEYLLEKPIFADIALLRGSIVDENGSIFYKGTTRNFNPYMATAADLVIVAGEEIVPIGDIPAEHIMTPGIFVDYVVGGEKSVCESENC